jgi:hypothetical protein
MGGIMAGRFLRIALCASPLIADALVRGQVVDGRGASISAGIVTLKVKGGRIWAVENIRADGTFSFPAGSPGQYAFSCEVSGFKRKTIPLTVEAESEIIDLGPIAVEVSRIEEPIAIPYEPSTAPGWLKADPDATVLASDPPSATIQAPDRRLPSCTTPHRRGRRIVSPMDLFEFFIPRSAPITKQQDIDYLEYYIFFGQKESNLWLRLMFGSTACGGFDRQPSASIDWIKTPWICPQVRGIDVSGKNKDGRRWRSLSFASGCASYEALPPDAADYFDQILDTACCGKCAICN